MAEIDQIYYGPGDARSRLHDEVREWGKDFDPLLWYGELVSDAELIWEK